MKTGVRITQMGWDGHRKFSKGALRSRYDVIDHPMAWISVQTVPECQLYSVKRPKVTAGDGEGRVVWRRRVDHRDLPQMRQQLRAWPAGTPVVLEATFGWGWTCDELTVAGLDLR